MNSRRIISTPPPAEAAQTGSLAEDDELPDALASTSAPGDEPEWRQAAVAAADHGARVDLALTRLVPEFSRSYLQQLIDSDAVRLNGRAVTRAAQRVKVGDVLAVELRPTLQSQAFRPEPMDLVVLHEDEHLLVIDKPAGLVVHPAPGHWGGTLLNGLLARHACHLGLPRAGIVHRLDKDTSGLMVVARRRSTMDALVALIAAREVRREYVAVSDRPWYGPSPRDIDAPIGRDPLHRQRMAVVDLDRTPGKSARTTVECLDTASTGCLVHARLHTGRTHQIRVHLSHIGLPLACDPLYGGRPVPGIARQALHAWRLCFVHPVTGAAVAFESPWPADLRAALAALGLGYNRALSTAPL